MSIEISDDEDNIPSTLELQSLDSSVMVTIDDNDDIVSLDLDCFTSDSDSSPTNHNINRKKVINNLFPTKKDKPIEETIFPSVQLKPQLPVVTAKHEKIIGGVKITLPVEPYGCQIALMYKVITAINRKQNCLLESPTGSGKTLALLCSALAWQQQEKKRIEQLESQQYFSAASQQGSTAADASIVNTELPQCVDYKSYFAKFSFGGKSIYDSPSENTSSPSADCCAKRPESCLRDANSAGSYVTLHKKARHTVADPACDHPDPVLVLPPSTGLTPGIENVETDCEKVPRLPKIFYGARTHKQLQQVIKEFKSTSYCGEALMTVLGSRDHCCIREYDSSQWTSKNDMCRGCVSRTFESKTLYGARSTQCKYYDNRESLSHRSAPPAFDLEELVALGRELQACPYYAARAMTAKAHIVFCPYNYLLDPAIRSSMSSELDLRDNILIIDEAHNIEDVCREAATFTFTRGHILMALKELEKTAEYRYSNEDGVDYVGGLIRVLKNWDDWFVNHGPLLSGGEEATHTWQPSHFLATLTNHNIGGSRYLEFKHQAELFCKRLREDPRALPGITQSTGTLVESLCTALGYFYQDDGKYANDFKPALVKTSWERREANVSQSSAHSQSERDGVSLRLVCLNPGVVFAATCGARCVVLASGTLTPLHALPAELAASFPLHASPGHVIPADRVWVGTLGSCEDGSPLECTARGTAGTRALDALGAAVARVARVTPHGVLCFVPSYSLMARLVARWRETGLWGELNKLKHVFSESRNVRDHSDIMDDYYKYAKTKKGALLLAVYRGKVSEGMDFKDEQARAVITIGIPYPNTFELGVREKMRYNDSRAAAGGLLPGGEWLRVQAYRALNQAVGRCVRHRGDWGAVLLVDARFARPGYRDHLARWANNLLGNNHHTFSSAFSGQGSLEAFMRKMSSSP